jgi:hypothetical protein
MTSALLDTAGSSHDDESHQHSQQWKLWKAHASAVHKYCPLVKLMAVVFTGYFSAGSVKKSEDSLLISMAHIVFCPHEIFNTLSSLASIAIGGRAPS